MTQRELVYSMLNGENPRAIINGWRPFEIIRDDLLSYIFPVKPGSIGKDIWGVTHSWEMGQPGPMPLEGKSRIVCKDIRHWQEYVKAPDIEHMSFQWESAQKQIKDARANGKLATSYMPTGIFELVHNLLGFQQAMMSFLEEPLAMHELIDYLTEFRMKYLRLLIHHLQPDVLLAHDDWGLKTSLLMSPDTWREFLKPSYRKMYRYVAEQKVIVMHHADSYLEPIVKDMAEIGIQIWQGVLPQNNITKIQKELMGSMILFGGIDAAVVDHAVMNEAAIKNEVQRACREYLKGGNFIPGITYGLPECIYPGVAQIIENEIDKFSY